MEVSANASRSRRAFTLVELLTVIVIIGILAGLITAAAQSALRKAREARVTLEIDLLSVALEKYKETYGDYPPDNLSSAKSAAVELHLRQAFPRYRPSGSNTLYQQFVADVKATTSNQFDPSSVSDSATALVFWLGGVPTVNGGKWKPQGFSKDVQNPFGSGAQRTEPLFDFDPDRLVYSSGIVHYYPDLNGAIAAVRPYVYFRARNKDYSTATAQGGLLPYARTTTEWYNPGTFQIISAGLDNNYGTGSQIIANGIAAGQAAHYDNLTNFAKGRLEDLF